MIDSTAQCRNFNSHSGTVLFRLTDGMNRTALCHFYNSCD